MGYSTKTVAALGAMTLAAVGAGGVVYLNSDNGPMRISQEAADVSDKQVDNDVVRYYDDVCSVANNVVDTPLRLLDTAEKTVGDNPDDTARKYYDTLRRINDTFDVADERLVHINSTAPIAVRADGVDTDYTGAIDGMIAAVGDSRSDITDLTSDFDNFHESDDKKAQTRFNDLSSRSVETISDHVSSITDSLSSLHDGAPIYTHATHNAVMNTTACTKLMDNDFSGDSAQSLIVGGVVDARSAVDYSHQYVSGSLMKLNYLQHMSTATPEQLHSTVTEMWIHIKDEADSAVGRFERLDNPYREGSKEFEATHTALDAVMTPTDTHDSAVETYKQVGRVADDIIRELSETDPSDTDGISQVMDNHDDDIRSAQIAEARFYIFASTHMDVPTSATNHRIEEVTHSTSGADEEVIDSYNRVKDANDDVSTALTDLSDAGNSLQGMDISAARSLMADKISALAQAARSAQGRVDVHEADIANAAGDVSTWADSAADRIRTSSDESLQDTLEAVMGELNDHTGQMGAATASYYVNFPNVNQATQARLDV